jgi:hypothetical protein
MPSSGIKLTLPVIIFEIPSKVILPLMRLLSRHEGMIHDTVNRRCAGYSLCGIQADAG